MEISQVFAFFQNVESVLNYALVLITLVTGWLWSSTILRISRNWPQLLAENIISAGHSIRKLLKTQQAKNNASKM